MSEITPKAIIVMGVSGSGKSTLGALLSDRIGAPFLEGDSFHSPQAIAKMSAGQPLDDADRWPWLDRLGSAIGEAVAERGAAVAACSALKRGYRERLRQRIGVPVAFILLDVDRDELTRRLNNRPNHYMPASLIASQLDALERPQADEPIITLDARRPPEELIEASCNWLRPGARPGLSQGR